MFSTLVFKPIRDTLLAIYRHTRGTHVQSAALKQTGATLASSELKNEKKPHLIIDENEDKSRIDRVLCRLLGQEKRTLILRLIRKGNVRVNGKRIKPEFRVHEGDSIFLPASLRPHSSEEHTSEQHSPNQQVQTFMPAIKNLITLYEDDDLLIIDKQAGIVVHGGSGHDVGLVERLKAQLNLPELRLAHRLDRDTSGCLLLAKNLKTLRKLTESFRNRDAHKTYLAWVTGHPYPYAGRMQSKLLKGVTQSGERMVVNSEHGQEAITDLQTILLREHEGWQYSLVALQPHSGRTHQLRVQLQQEGHAILGDPKYAEKADTKHYKTIKGKGLALHAWRLRFEHPSTGKILECRAPWPKRWAHFKKET
jgi:23S rRNA pseudouridine955/2504/2580 synthase